MNPSHFLATIRAVLLAAMLTSFASAAELLGSSPKVIAQLARGAGPEEIGITDTTPESLPAGPNGLIDATNGGVLILDSVNKRILRISDAGKVSLAATIESSGLAQDIVRLGNAVYVLDGQPVYVGIDRGFGQIGGDNSRESGDGPQKAPSLFETNGAVLSAPDSGVPESSDLISNTGKWLSAPGVRGAIDLYRIVRGKDDASVELRSSGNKDARRSLSLPATKQQIGSIGLIGSDKSGNAYVRFEEISSQGGAARTKVWVARFDKRGKPAGGYDVPDDSMQLIPNRYLAVTPGGMLYFLQSRHDRTQVMLLNLMTEREFNMRHKATMSAILQIPPTPPTVSAEAGLPNKIKRDDILKAAEAFRSAEWTLGHKNFRGDVVSACVPAKGQLWRRPPQLDKMEGKRIVGIPYNWGGSMSVAEFQDRISKNAVAGNVCTCRADSNCVDSKIAGVDCSGFLSQAWQIKHHTTASLGEVGKRLFSFRELKPGDALNKPNSHVRLYVGNSPSGNGTLRAYESSLSCGGVCIRDFTSKQLEGYVALAAPVSD